MPTCPFAPRIEENGVGCNLGTAVTDQKNLETAMLRV